MKLLPTSARCRNIALLQTFTVLGCLTAAAFGASIPDALFFEQTRGPVHDWRTLPPGSDLNEVPSKEAGTIVDKYSWEMEDRTASGSAKAQTVLGGFTPSGGPLPNALATLTVDSHYGSAAVEAQAKILWYFELVPLHIPYVDLALVRIIANGSVVVDGTADFVGSGLTTLSLDGGTIGDASCGGVDQCQASFKLTGQLPPFGKGVYLLGTNMPHTLFLWVRSSGDVYIGNGGVTAQLDPAVELAPEFQDQFKLVFSPNLEAAAVPEPGTIALIGVGLLLLVLRAGWRRMWQAQMSPVR